MITVEDVPPAVFGDVSPCLAIAKKYDIDWRVPLYIVHMRVHKEYLPGYKEVVIDIVPPEMRNDLLSDCDTVADRTRVQHQLADERDSRGELVFYMGAWTHVPMVPGDAS